MAGWVKLFRKVRDRGWYRDRVVRSVFFDLLLTASFTDKEIFIGRRRYELKEGQVLTTAKRIANAISEEERAVRRALDCLIHGRIVSRSTVGRLSLISIIKWQDYNGYKTEVCRESGNVMTALAVANTIYKEEEDKNIRTLFTEGAESSGRKIPRSKNPFYKKVRDRIYLSDAELGELEKLAVQASLDLDQELDSARDWLLSSGKRKSDHAAFMRNWIKRAIASQRRYKPRGDENRGQPMSSEEAQAFLRQTLS